MPVPAEFDILICHPEELVMVPALLNVSEVKTLPLLKMPELSAPEFEIVIVPELVMVPEVVRVPPLKMPLLSVTEFDMLICPPEELVRVPMFLMPRKLEFDIVIVPPERLKTLLSLSILMPEPLLFDIVIVPELSISPPKKSGLVVRLLMPTLSVPEFDMLIVAPKLFTIKPRSFFIPMLLEPAFDIVIVPELVIKPMFVTIVDIVTVIPDGIILSAVWDGTMPPIQVEPVFQSPF